MLFFTYLTLTSSPKIHFTLQQLYIGHHDNLTLYTVVRLDKTFQVKRILMQLSMGTGYCVCSMTLSGCGISESGTPALLFVQNTGINKYCCPIERSYKDVKQNGTSQNSLDDCK